MGPIQTRAGPLGVGEKWALRRAQNIFMAKNINCIAIINTLEGIKKIKTGKKKKNYNRKRQQTPTWLLDFYWLTYIVHFFVTILAPILFLLSQVHTVTCA